MSNQKIKLLPCPFCGATPIWGRGKRGSCQLHGEPFQAVTIHCVVACPAKPMVSAGDIYNGGEHKARLEAAAIWNKRADQENNDIDFNQLANEAEADERF